MAENKGKSTSNKTQLNMDNPEQYPTENESLFDKFEIEQTVDPITIEDLKEEQR